MNGECYILTYRYVETHHHFTRQEQGAFACCTKDQSTAVRNDFEGRLAFTDFDKGVERENASRNNTRPPETKRLLHRPVLPKMSSVAVAVVR